MGDTEPQTQAQTPEQEPPNDNEDAMEGDEPWAILIGMGPTSTHLIKLFAPCVEIGNATKNPNAQIRIDDPRIRQVPHQPAPSLSVSPRARSSTFPVQFMHVAPRPDVMT